ncbi:MAG: hypothetical protein CVV64_16585 [Candidatus Wallbacteria bacterium HGW-Wallbacteria-1]|jgi:hypothetical protein|uniref:Uncharacterized protein n=1 Tax=Candidatus Wallbacteria bacterium HGW-Wallbacteria-1 TaxID=2013854 RepID=A0A2N1PKT3_9BACT|nr:MAG: hypothetical protein CVV64_16585 [Candidatus Wallbacteria bacterium HGW-Wallbacteria-1]
MTDKLEPKAAFKLIRRLMKNFIYDPGFEPGNEWIYASQESSQYGERLQFWLDGKSIPFDEKIMVIICCPHPEISEMIWSYFLKNWPELLVTEDIIVTNESFTWALEYKTQKIARFGRKSNII